MGSSGRERRWCLLLLLRLGLALADFLAEIFIKIFECVGDVVRFLGSLDFFQDPLDGTNDHKEDEEYDLTVDAFHGDW